MNRIGSTGRHVSKVPEADLTVPGYFARLNTTSSVVLGNKPGLVNFNSLSVSEVMVRFSVGSPVRFANVLAWISTLRTLLASSSEYFPK
jgi:hypothetical protein